MKNVYFVGLFPSSISIGITRLQGGHYEIFPHVYIEIYMKITPQKIISNFYKKSVDITMMYVLY